MFHDKDRQLVVYLQYNMVKNELAFLITKTLFIRSYSINCVLGCDSCEHNIMHYIIALANNSLSHSKFQPKN